MGFTGDGYKFGPTIHGPMGFFSVWIADSMEASEGAFAVMVFIEALLLLVGAMYFADVVSGIVHLFLDYEVGSNDELRLHVEHSIPDVVAFEASSDLFKNAKPRDKYLWNFHSHHDAAYPSADSNWELVRQIVVPTSPWVLLFVVVTLLGVWPMWLACIVIGGAHLAVLTQFTHFLAHARGRGLVQSRILCKLQDWHIILDHETHRSHHVHFDRDFCIFNGWGNPLVNRLRRFGSYVGYFPKVAPTVTTRAEREQRKGTAQQCALKENVLTAAEEGHAQAVPKA